MKNEKGKSSNNIGSKLKRKEKPKDDNKGKSFQEKSCAMINLARAMSVSRREVSKNIFKKERKLELTDYCVPVENCTEKTLSENKICTDTVM